MKTIDLSTKEFFDELFPEPTAIKFANKLAKYNIESAEQLYGVLNPMLPKLSKSEIAARGLTSSYNKIAEKANSEKAKIYAIRKTLNISTSEAKKIIDSLETIPIPLQAMKKNSSELSMGLIQSSFRTKSNFWNTTSFNALPKQFVLPNYEKMGPVFDQGRRGTCVANAFCSLFDYLTGEKTSRQFIYHQCKMVDAIPHLEGTYMHVPIRLMSMPQIFDYGIVKEELWRYNPQPTSTFHQGPPPEICFNSPRYYNQIYIATRRNSIIDDIKQLLVGSSIHKPMPVAIGLNLFQSFSNAYSRRTGIINMPLPGEKRSGGHAMLIVGYYDDKKLFLVRNSWGTKWAPENPYGYAGHALIPYQYIAEHSDGVGFTFLSLKQKHIEVPLNKRLYKTKIVLRTSNTKAEALKSGNEIKHVSSKNKIRYKKNIRLKYFLLGIAAALVAIYHNEIMHFMEPLIDWVQKNLK